MNITTLVKEIDARFVSANAVPVSRAGITKQEWEFLRAAINALGEIATGRAEELFFGKDGGL